MTARQICGRAKFSPATKSPVCKKAADHDGRHTFDYAGAWGERNESGRYIVPTVRDRPARPAHRVPLVADAVPVVPHRARRGPQRARHG